jgi:hypothetical protein
MDTKQLRRFLIAMVIVLLLLAKLAESVYYGSFEYRQRTKKFNRILAAKEAVTNNSFTSLRSYLGKGEHIDTVSQSNVIKTLESEGITLLWYLDKKLVYWSDNSFDIPLVYDDSLFAKQMVFIHNGWFLVRSEFSGNERIVLLLRITHDYGFDNDIVKNGFVSAFNLPENTKLLTDRNASPFHVTDSKGNWLFSLQFPVARSPSGYIVLPVLLWIAALILALLTLSIIVKQLAEKGRPYLALSLALVVSISIYLIILLVREPKVFFETGLFSGYRFSLNGWVPSLGHLLILSTLLAIMAWIFLKYLRIKLPSGEKTIFTFLIPLRVSFRFCCCFLSRSLSFSVSLSKARM